MPRTPCPPEPRDLAGLRVLHVVQKYSSGVGAAIAQYTRSLPSVEHHLLSGTPVDAEGDLAEQADFATTREMSGSHFAKVRRVRAVVGELQPDVVHAHSSHGGIYARLAVSRAGRYLVYSPHCYAFERLDVSAAGRAVFWAAEAMLALNTSAFAACSEREWQLSDWSIRRAPRYVVPNIAPAPRRRSRTGPADAPVLVGGGRLSAQKDPYFFLACFDRVRGEHPGVRGLWLGDGDAAARRALEAGGVEVSGWLPRAATMDFLGAADLYLHSARWEGFPLMVAEAAALGVPTLVRRLPCFAGVPPELTVAGDDPTPSLACLRDPAAGAANVDAWSRFLERNTLATQRAALIAVYAGAQ